jgi:hypothetical protein
MRSAVILLLASAVPSARGGEAAGFPHFDAQQIDNGLGVGYAVLPADIDGDGKTDLVVVDQRRVVWYQNPTWKRRNVIDGQTAPDNVCVAALDIDGDGKVDLALGAGWRPFDTRSGGTLQWLRQPSLLDEPWTVHAIAEEPTLHRIRFANLHGDRPALLVGPLMGRGSTAAANWADGQPVRLLAYHIPKDPARDRWMPEVIDESLHVLHNFTPVPAGASRRGTDILTASYEGVHLLSWDGVRWNRRQIGAGNQDNPWGSRGASEVKQGHLRGGRPYVATIEPWHGHQVVVYTPPPAGGKGLWQRHVLDDRLRWGHAVWCADLDGDGDDELIVGVRDDLSARPGERCGVRVYKSVSGCWERSERLLVDEGGVAVEDLAVADLDGDGRPDLIAVGRATHNARIYWNRGRR